MEDSKLESRQQKFMKVNFNIVDAREQHILSLRKNQNNQIITDKRVTNANKHFECGLQIDIDMLSVSPTSLKKFEINSIVSIY
jgi:hypothetical protein